MEFNADAWVAVAKNAGMKYIVITSKHHDGFAMFGSKASHYNIVDATPFHRDPMKELAAACQRAGIKLCFYYSQTQDWHEPDAVGNTWDFPDRNQEGFLEVLREQSDSASARDADQLRIPSALIWFDTPRNITQGESLELVDMVHKLQSAMPGERARRQRHGRLRFGRRQPDQLGETRSAIGRRR